jgi:hypothetical protein
MKITRFVATEDGGSRFEEFDIPLDNERQGAGGYTLMSSEMFSSDAVCFVSLPADLDQDWHQAPARQLVQLITGAVEVTTTDGDVRRWHGGDLFMAADVSGQGHKTRVVDGPAIVMFVPLSHGVFM